MYILLNWYSKDSIFVVSDPVSLNPILFETEEEARHYAVKELNGEWRIVDLF